MLINIALAIAIAIAVCRYYFLALRSSFITSTCTKGVGCALAYITIYYWARCFTYCCGFRAVLPPVIMSGHLSPALCPLSLRVFTQARTGQRVLTLEELSKQEVNQHRPVIAVNGKPEQL